MKGNLYGGMLQNLQLQPMTHVADHAGADGTGVGSHSGRLELIHWVGKELSGSMGCVVVLLLCTHPTKQGQPANGSDGCK
jgi:hypothetical protein